MVREWWGTNCLSHGKEMIFMTFIKCQYSYKYTHTHVKREGKRERKKRETSETLKKYIILPFYLPVLRD